MTLEQLLAAALGGSPVAIVVAVALKIVWSRYQAALDDREVLHGLIRDRDQAELDAWRSVAKPSPPSSLGSSSENARP
jgi:hypothetical protein